MSRTWTPQLTQQTLDCSRDSTIMRCMADVHFIPLSVCDDPTSYGNNIQYLRMIDRCRRERTGLVGIVEGARE